MIVPSPILIPMYRINSFIILAKIDNNYYDHRMSMNVADIV